MPGKACFLILPPGEWEYEGFMHIQIENPVFNRLDRIYVLPNDDAWHYSPLSDNVIIQLNW
jgi:hypothetical protein